MINLKSGVAIFAMNFYNAYVRSYTINENNEKEFFDIVRDVYFSDEVQGQAMYIQHADINRLQHVTSVAYMAYLYCKEIHADFRAAARAGVLHDLVYYDWHVAGDGTHRLHGYRHPGFAVKNAKALCNLSETEENIIRRHMWPLTPTPPKYKEGVILSIIDKYCAANEILIKKFSSYRDKFHNDINKLKSR